MALCYTLDNAKTCGIEALQTHNSENSHRKKVCNQCFGNYKDMQKWKFPFKIFILMLTTLLNVLPRSNKSQHYTFLKSLLFLFKTFFLTNQYFFR